MTSVVRIGSPFVSEKFIAKRVSDVRLRVCFEKPSGIEFFFETFSARTYFGIFFLWSRSNCPLYGGAFLSWERKKCPF